MKIRFNPKQWENYLYIYYFAQWKYGTQITPEHFVKVFHMMYEDVT